MKWRLRWGEYEWSSDDVTVAHGLAVGVLLGRHEWLALEPPRSPEFVHAWLIVLLGSEVGASAAMAQVNGAPLSALAGAVVVPDEE